MKTTIESLDFPSEIKNKLKMKVSTTNLKIEFLSGHIIKIDKTNLSVREPHRIIVNNSNKIGLKLNISPIVNILKPIKFKKQSKTKIINNEFFDIYFLILSTYFTLNYYQCSIFYYFSQFLLDYHKII